MLRGSGPTRLVSRGATIRLLRAGAAIMEPFPSGGEGPAITPKGRGLRRAREGKRMTLDAADALLGRVLDRLGSGVAGELGIVEVGLFGSVMRREPFPADVDLAMVSVLAGTAGAVPSELRVRALGPLASEPALRDVWVGSRRPSWIDGAVVWSRSLRVAPREPFAASAGWEGEPVEYPEPDDPADVVRVAEAAGGESSP